MKFDWRLLEREVVKRVRLPYGLWLPEGYERPEAQPWPLLLFLHGRGERGESLEILAQHGIPRYLREGHTLPLIVVAPQCPAESDWGLELDAVQAVLSEVETQYAVDPGRIYLTGLSMGGRGAWLLASARPERFAALVPICARRPENLRSPQALGQLKHIPVWAFHGARDTVVPVEESRLMVEAFRGCGGEARLTIFPEARHDAWTEAYAQPELYTWLLKQRAQCFLEAAPSVIARSLSGDEAI